MSVILVALFACEFEGERHLLRFDSNLLRPGAPWQPTLPVAAGTAARFVVRGPVGEGNRQMEVAASVRGADVIDVDGSTVTVVGRHGGARLWWQGERDDGFRLAFREVADAGIHGALGQLDDDGAVVVLEGATLPVHVDLRDRRGASLGFAGQDVAVVAEGAAQWVGDPDDGALTVDGDGGVVVSFLGDDVAEIRVVAVPASEIASLSVVEVGGADGEVWLGLLGARADGTEVGGLVGSWQHDDEGPAFRAAPDVDEVVVQWGDLEAHWAR